MTDSNRLKILVTPEEACGLLGSLPENIMSAIEVTATRGRIDDPKKLIELMSDKDGVVLDLEKITGDVLKHCPKLKVISRFGEGCDAIDFHAAKEYGVRVARTEGVSSMSVARHAVALIMAIVHNIVGNDAELKEGRWTRRPNLSEQDLTVGILGAGKIGKAVAGILTKLGFSVIVHSRKTDDSGYRYAASINELISLSDIVSLHCPLTAETKGIISPDIIARLRGKYLVNTSRGGLVDEAALLAALEEDAVSGYATDVFSLEPVCDVSKRLAMHRRVLSSPHVAAMDRRTAVNMTKRAIENALYSITNSHDKVVSYVS